MDNFLPLSQILAACKLSLPGISHGSADVWLEGAGAGPNISASSRIEDCRQKGNKEMRGAWQTCRITSVWPPSLQCCTWLFFILSSCSSSLPGAVSSTGLCCREFSPCQVLTSCGDKGWGLRAQQPCSQHLLQETQPAQEHPKSPST